MSEKVDLFNMDAEDASLSFLNNGSKTNDGIYRPAPKDAKDKSKGYVATIRFIPNLLADGTLGQSAIEKAIHYANLSDYPDLSGYYDSLINFGEKCPLTTLYWKLKNSKNQAEVERASLINRSTKYYSYILVIEDEQHPEYEGKIMIFPYGFKIRDKINNERTGENTDGKKCNVFDPANGKDFRLIVKEIGGFPNYDSSMFRSVSPMSLWSENDKKFRQLPVEFNEEKEKNVITNKKAQTMLMDFLNSRTVHLEDHTAKQWSDETKSKVEKIVEILSGNSAVIAKKHIEESTTSTTSSTSVTDSSFDETSSDDLDDFFGED